MYTNDMVEYWLELSDMDFRAAKVLFAGEMYLHCAFFCHQSLEKALKAHIVQAGDIPPKIHVLKTLIERTIGWDSLSEEHHQTIDDVDDFDIQGRYPDEVPIPRYGHDFCGQLLGGMEVLLCFVRESLERD
ncbi:MAG: HEPN domain-containing protein [Clostridiales bacterium]|nr:HEPN domain-containing protein [Clostridiales bacterium]